MYLRMLESLMYGTGGQQVSTTPTQRLIDAVDAAMSSASGPQLV